MVLCALAPTLRDGRSQGIVRTEPVIAFPPQAERAVSVPFVDAVGSATNGFAQQWFAGNFDGDGRLDVALLAGTASCVRARSSSAPARGTTSAATAGDYRCVRPAAAAARFRTSTYPQDQLVYAERATRTCASPTGLWSNHPGFAEATFLAGVGAGVTEMTAADLDGNGHDEIYPPAAPCARDDRDRQVTRSSTARATRCARCRRSSSRCLWT
jgi:hypothetical protein